MREAGGSASVSSASSASASATSSLSTSLWLHVAAIWCFFPSLFLSGTLFWASSSEAASPSSLPPPSPLPFTSQSRSSSSLASVFGVGSSSSSSSAESCGEGQFQCLQLNLNQILSINDWNRRPRECIEQIYRCDGRHDCQDGSDEVECFVQLPRRKKFRCFVGDASHMSVEDCLERDRKNPVTDTKETSRSVTEMKEWVCSKITRPNGDITRNCLRLYTGGEAFRVCYTNYADGSTCLCSSELCNGAATLHSRGSWPVHKLLLIIMSMSLAITTTAVNVAASLQNIMNAWPSMGRSSTQKRQQIKCS